MRAESKAKEMGIDISECRSRDESQKALQKMQTAVNECLSVANQNSALITETVQTETVNILRQVADLEKRVIECAYGVERRLRVPIGIFCVNSVKYLNFLTG